MVLFWILVLIEIDLKHTNSDNDEMYQEGEILRDSESDHSSEETIRKFKSSFCWTEHIHFSPPI